ncbi:MAG: hypothetical protein ACLFR8_04800 [Alkalispirochaeta sp.]
MKKEISKGILAALIVLIPVLFLANVRQSYRFSRLESRLQAVHREHLALLEENKRLIVGVAGLRSPDRIRDLAENELGLEAAPADRVERIRIRGERFR